MTTTTKSILIASFFRVFDYPTVLAVSMDPETQVTQHFKNSLNPKEVTQAEIAAVIFSMQ
jgi:hypothetical protein